MRTLTVERLDSVYVFCSDAEKKLYAIEQSELPADVAVGNLLMIDEEGKITVCKQKPTDRRKKR